MPIRQAAGYLANLPRQKCPARLFHHLWTLAPAPFPEGLHTSDCFQNSPSCWRPETIIHSASKIVIRDCLAADNDKDENNCCPIRRERSSEWNSRVARVKM